MSDKNLKYQRSMGDTKRLVLELVGIDFFFFVSSMGQLLVIKWAQLAWIVTLQLKRINLQKTKNIKKLDVVQIIFIKFNVNQTLPCHPRLT